MPLRRGELDGEGGGAGRSPGRPGGALGRSCPRTVRRYLALRNLPGSARPAGRRTPERDSSSAPPSAGAGALAAGSGHAGGRKKTGRRPTSARVCAALVRAPGVTLDDAVGGGHHRGGGVDRLGPAPRVAAPAEGPARMARAPRGGRAPAGPAGAGQGDEADLWLEDATGARRQKPWESPPRRPPLQPRHAVLPAVPGAEPETANGHRVFRIRTCPPFATKWIDWPAVSRTATSRRPPATMPVPSLACAWHPSSWRSSSTAWRVY